MHFGIRWSHRGSVWCSLQIRPQQYEGCSPWMKTWQQLTWILRGPASPTVPCGVASSSSSNWIRNAGLLDFPSRLEVFQHSPPPPLPAPTIWELWSAVPKITPGVTTLSKTAAFHFSICCLRQLYNKTDSSNIAQLMKPSFRRFEGRTRWILRGQNALRSCAKDTAFTDRVGRIPPEGCVLRRLYVLIRRPLLSSIDKSALTSRIWRLHQMPPSWPGISQNALRSCAKDTAFADRVGRILRRLHLWAN